MLKVKDVAVRTEGYGDAYECTVTFQIGPQSYSTVPVKLLPEAARAVVELAIAKATAMLVVEPTDIKIAGEARILPTKEATAPPPEFAEVEEYQPPVVLADEPKAEEFL